MDSLPKRPNTPPSPPRRGSRHVSPPTVQRPGPSSWEPPRPRSPGVWDRDRGRPMYRPRSRSRSRSYDYNYDYRRRSPPPPHHSRLPRRAWERSRSRSPPPPPKSSVPCKYFSRPTGCDKGSRCRFRHDEPRGRSFSRSRSRSRSPRSRSPPLRYRRGESPMLVPRGGMRSPQPSLLQRLGPVAPMKPISPMRSRAVSNDPNEPLEEGEERSPGRRGGATRGKGRRRNDQGRDKGNWDSFVADEDEDMSEGGRGGRKTYESRRGRSRSRSPRQRTRSPSRSRSRSPRNTDTVPTRSNSQEKRSHHSAPYPPRHSRSRSRSRSARMRSSTRSRDRTPSQGRSRTRSRSHSPSGRSRSRSRSPRPERDREPAAERDREPAIERDSKNPPPAANPGSSSATAGPAIPTGPRLRTGANSQAPGAPAPRATPAPGRGGPPPTGPRGDREPPRGPRNMVASGIAAGVAGGAGPGPAPSWERPQSAFQTYLAAVQSKLDQREGKKKDDGPAPDSEAEAKTTDVPVESDAMDVDVAEEHGPVGSQSHTPLPGPSVEGSRVASPAYPNLNARQASASLHASPAVGQNTPLPTVSTPSALGGSLPLPHTLPPRPRSPPRGPRATRAPVDRPKGPGLESGVGDAERTRDRNDWVGGEINRKVHAPPANPQRPRRATKREALFPDLEKELANLEEQRARLANDHLPLEIALRQAVDELALTTIDCRAAEDRRVMTETVLEAMVKGGGLAAGDI